MTVPQSELQKMRGRIVTCNSGDLRNWLSGYDTFFLSRANEPPCIWLLRAAALGNGDAFCRLAALVAELLRDRSSFSALSDDLQYNYLSLAAGLDSADLLAAPLRTLEEERVLRGRAWKGVPLEGVLLHALIHNQTDDYYHYHWMSLLDGESFLGGNRFDGCRGVFYERPMLTSRVYLVLVKIAAYLRQTNPDDLPLKMNTLRAELLRRDEDRFSFSEAKDASYLELRYPDSILAGLARYVQRPLEQDFRIDVVDDRVVEVYPTGGVNAEKILRKAREYVVASSYPSRGYGLGPAPNGEDAVICHLYDELERSASGERADLFRNQRARILGNANLLEQAEVPSAGDAKAIDIKAIGQALVDFMGTLPVLNYNAIRPAFDAQATDADSRPGGSSDAADCVRLLCTPIAKLDKSIRENQLTELLDVPCQS